jgi:hypothetical protein
VKVTLDISQYGMTPDKFLGWLRDGLGGEFRRVADDIEAQLPKPRPGEPREFGSVVRASAGSGSNRILWIRTSNGAWFGEGTAAVGGYALLSDVEVLRVGVGAALPSQDEIKTFILNNCAGCFYGGVDGETFADGVDVVGLLAFLAGGSGE